MVAAQRPFPSDFELLVQDEHLDSVAFHAINAHGVSGRRGVQNLHECVVVRLCAHRDHVAVDCREVDGLGDRLTSKEIAMRPKTLFSLRRIFDVSSDENLGHVVPP
jgi:hypothetical protein